MTAVSASPLMPEEVPPCHDPDASGGEVNFPVTLTLYPTYIPATAAI
jgi:hypothetical protein